MGRFCFRDDPPGFLDSELRCDLIELARDGSAEHRLARRANALLLLDQGMSCQSIAEVLFLDGDTVHPWYHLYQEDGIEGWRASAMKGHLSADAQTHHPQQVLQLIQGLQHRNAELPADDVPRNWRTYCAEVTDNFRIIDPKKFRIIV